MTRLRLLAAGVGAYALALVIGAPASLLGARLADASDGRLRLTRAHGTLWSGHGRIELRDAAGNTGLTLPCAWRLRPASLWRARLDYAIDTGPGEAPASVAMGWSRVEIADLRLGLPASALGSLQPALASFGLTGDVELRIDRLSLGREAADGSATVQWRSAGSGLAPLSPLGDYEIRLDAQGRSVDATLRTLQGPLDVVGHGRWPTGGRPAFVATARVPPDLRATLLPFLRLVSVERNDGSFEWTLVQPAAASHGVGAP